MLFYRYGQYIRGLMRWSLTLIFGRDAYLGTRRISILFVMLHDFHCLFDFCGVGAIMHFESLHHIEVFVETILRLLGRVRLLFQWAHLFNLADD